MIKLYVVKRLNLVNDPPYYSLRNDRVEWKYGMHNATFFALPEDAFVIKNQLDERDAILKNAVLEIHCDPKPVELFTQQVEEE